MNIHEGLTDAELLAAHKAWKEEHFPGSQWFFPSHFGGKYVNKGALAHALRRLQRKGMRKLTSAWDAGVLRDCQEEPGSN